MKFCDVILPLALPGSFIYHIDDNLGEISEGMRVIVEFGKRKQYSAIVIRLHNEKPEKYETKPVLSVIDNQPVVNGFQLKLWKWIAEYYMCNLGEVLNAALPAGLKMESETKLFLNRDFYANNQLAKNEEEILDFLTLKGPSTISEINNVLSVKNAYPYLNSLVEKNAISTEEILKDAFKPKMEIYISLSKEFNEEKALESLFDSLQRAKKQLELVMSYLELLNTDKKNEEGISKSRLLEYARTNAGVLKSLVDKGIFIEQKKEVNRTGNEGNTFPIKQLTNIQEECLHSVHQKFEKKATVLLHGVTSSGKTEIYIHLIREYLELKKQVLYLLPEIALTTQIINRLRNVFGNRVGVYHSKFNDNERVEVYNRVMKPFDHKDAVQLILGVRSSVFLPFHDLGLVIVDEEHENTYKQYDPAPRYNARDTSIYLAMLHGAKVLMGTATPSVESYYNAKKGKYGLVEIKERYKGIEMPEIIVSDTREAYRKKMMQSLFTPALLNQLKETLERGEQAILFKNRRGYAPYIECHSCNWIPYCKNCDVTMTYHRNNNELVCHYCGHSRTLPVICDVCNQPALQTKGYGTEKIEDELAIFFPDKKIMRMDMDSTKSKKAYEKMIGAFEAKEVDILVGTQMISKGLDFENVSLVGVLNADQMLNFPDFRAHERSFQLMAQVSGRAGRKNKQGKVIIQVGDAGHPIITDVINNNYRAMFLRQLEERKLFKYPPFHRLILLKVKHRDKAMVNRASYFLAQNLFNAFGNRVSGPEFPLVERVQNLYQKNILLKIEAEKAGNKAKGIIQNAIVHLQAQKDFRTIKVIVDVDPA